MPEESREVLAAFRQGLIETGYNEKQNITSNTLGRRKATAIALRLAELVQLDAFPCKKYHIRSSFKPDNLPAAQVLCPLSIRCPVGM